MKVIGTTAAGNELIEAPAGHTERIRQIFEQLNAVFIAWGGLFGTGNDSTQVVGNTPAPIAPVIKTKPARTCSECGATIAPDAPGARKTCGPVCAEKRKVAKAAAKRATISGRDESRICLTCGKSFQPRRKDQACCNMACASKRPKKARSGKPAPAAAQPTPPPAVNKAARLEMIKRAAKALPPVPPDPTYVDDDDITDDRD